MWIVIGVRGDEGSKLVGMGCRILVACCGGGWRDGALSSSRLDSCCRVTKKAELVLVDAAVKEPVELHVHGFGLFRLDMTVDDAFSSAVVSLDRSRGLMMTQFL